MGACVSFVRISNSNLTILHTMQNVSDYSGFLCSRKVRFSVYVYTILPQGQWKNRSGVSVRSSSALSLQGSPVPISAAAQPKTGTQTFKREVREETLSKFFKGPTTCTPTSGGVNNMVNYVETGLIHDIIIVKSGPVQDILFS